MIKIIRNQIKCKKCGEIIESTSRHDFKFCKCGAVAVDGGKDYLQRVGNKDDYEELIEYTKAAMMMSENMRFVMDETGRPYEPGEPEYERAVQETPESLAFEKELIHRFRLQDDKK